MTVIATLAANLGRGVGKQSRYPTRGLMTDAAVVAGGYVINRFTGCAATVVTVTADVFRRDRRVIELGTGKCGGVMTLTTVIGQIGLRIGRNRYMRTDWFILDAGRSDAIMARVAASSGIDIGVVKGRRYKAAAGCVTSNAIPGRRIGFMVLTFILDHDSTVRCWVGIAIGLVMAAFASLLVGAGNRRLGVIDTTGAGPGVILISLSRIQVTRRAISRYRNMGCVLAEYLAALRIGAIVAGFTITSDSWVVIFCVTPIPSAARIGVTHVTVLSGRNMAIDRSGIIGLAQDRIVRCLEFTVVAAFATIRV